MIRLLLFMSALAILAVWLGDPGRADQTDAWTPLFNGRDFTGWKVHLRDDKADPAKTFAVRDGVIHCTGQPNGYLITEREYGDYVLRVQWRWPETPGNSGVFVHVSGPDKVWPKGVEAQLMSGQAGDIWLVDGFRLTVDPRRLNPVNKRQFLRIGERWEEVPEAKTERDRYRAVRQQFEKPLGEWNQYEITCQGDTIKMVVNGQLVNEGTGAEATRGQILLQSEGAPIQFRNVEIKLLK